MSTAESLQLLSHFGRLLHGSSIYKIFSAPLFAADWCARSTPELQLSAAMCCVRTPDSKERKVVTVRVGKQPVPSFCFCALRLAARVVPDIVGRKQRNYRDGLLSIARITITVAQDSSNVYAIVSRNQLRIEMRR